MNDRVMICPRDGGTMTTYARAGVQIDQCDTCRGIFLDRGELEQLTAAEQSFYQQQPPTPAPYPTAGYPDAAYQPNPYYGDHQGGHHGGHHDERRQGFLHNLFD